MRLFQAAPDTPLDSPFSATLSVHNLHFTVGAPSNNLEKEKARRPIRKQGKEMRAHGDMPQEDGILT